METLGDLICSTINTKGEFNLLICGSRSIESPDYILEFLLTLLKDSRVRELKDKLFVVQGEARGIDLIAKYMATRLGIKTKDYPANWDELGKRAGYIRNQLMVDIADATLAVHDGVSKGTKHSMGISKKKGIPLMVNNDVLPTNLTTDEIVAHIVKKQAMSSLFFEVGIDLTRLIEKIDAISGTDVVEDIVQLVEEFGHKPLGFNDLPINYTTDRLLEANYRGYIVRIASAQVSRLRDRLIPKVVNRLYLKLDTGGLAGYQRTVGGRGEEVYPILRVTMGHNDDDDILDIFIKPKPGAIIDPKVLAMHEASGLMKNVETMGVDLEVASNQIAKFLNDKGVRSTNPVSNIHTHLIGFNAEFNRTFLTKQLPVITQLCSPKDISVDKLVAIYELASNYESIPLPQLYRNDPISYIKSLRSATATLGRPITIERMPF